MRIYSLVQWLMPVIPALKRLRQLGLQSKFEATLDYTVRLCLKKKKIYKTAHLYSLL
jgi:hypothetical protein